MNIEAVLIGLLSTTHTPEQAEHAARTVLRDHAHQLAEQQRKHFIPRPQGKSADYVRGLDDGLDAAADLIDPEVQR
ncbi:hypothetical protein ABTZ58_03805 [Streptomyces sp. NPDC094143]